MKTIEQQNAMIAEFMGGFDGWDFKMFETGTWEFQTPETLRTLITFKSNSIKTECFSTTIFKSYEVKFHTSLDWLMPVVEKIEKLNYDFEILGGCWVIIKDVDPDRDELTEIIEVSSETKMKTVYNAVCQFIEWYNANK